MIFTDNPSQTIHGDDGFMQQQLHQIPTGEVLPVNNSVQKKWRSEFAGSTLNLDKWDVFTNGSGMSYSTATGSWLSVTTGTTLDDEIRFLARECFTIPMRGMVALNLSQRIVGQTTTVEFVSVDPVTHLPDGQSVMAAKYDGTSATQFVYEVGSGGQPRLMSGASTIPNTAPTVWSIAELEAFADEAWIHGRVMDASTARSNSYVRHQQIPDPNSLYRLQLRITNRQWLNTITAAIAGTGGVIRLSRAAHGLTTGDNVTVANVSGLTGTVFPWTGTITSVDANTFELQGTTFAGTYINNGWAQYSRNVAPLSSTIVQFAFANVIDYAELTAEITAGRGNNVAGQGMSVNVNTMPTVSTSTQGSQADNSTTVPSPLLISVKAATAGIATPASTGRHQSLMGTTYGVAITKPWSIPELEWSSVAAAGGIINTTDVIAKASVAGLRNYVTSAHLANAHATVGSKVVIKDGATVIFRTHLAPGQREDVVFTTPLRGSIAAAINLACVTTGSAVYANLQGFTAP